MYGDESKQIPGRVKAKLDFRLLVASSCFRRLYGGPACIWQVASNGGFFLLTAAESKRIPSRSSCRSLHAQFVQTLKHKTVNFHNKRSPTVPYPKWSLRYALKELGEKVSYQGRSVLGHQITTSRAARAQW